MKKRVLAWILTVAMIVSNLPAAALAANYDSSSNVSAEDLEIGDTFTADSEEAVLPDTPDGTEWVGPQRTRVCTLVAHRHDEDCYCIHGGTSLSHWWHTTGPDGCQKEAPGCGYDEHTHTDEKCYAHSWTLEEVTTSAQYRNWWPVYWGFEDGSRVTSSDVVKVTTGRDDVKYASTTVSASAGLADVEKGETVNSGDVIDNEGFVVTVDPGYYVESWRLVCGNRFRCETNDYAERNYTANSEGDYTAEIIVPMNGESFNHWNGFNIQNSNSNGSYYVPATAPKSTDSKLYNSSAPYPFYLMVYVQQDNNVYKIEYDWGSLEGKLTKAVPDSVNNAVRNESYEVSSPDMYDGETEANELGYRFLGWQISGEGYDTDATVEPGASITCYGSDITLTALWETTVTYQYIGDLIPEGAEEQLPDSEHYAEGATVTVEDIPKVPGYTFTGWMMGSQKMDGGDTFEMPGEPVVFTGSFAKVESQTKEISYTVEYYFDHEKKLELQPDMIISDTVWVGDDDYLAVDTSEIVKDFTGWVYGGSDPDVLPKRVKDGSVIKLYYHDSTVTIDVTKSVKNLTQGKAEQDTSVTKPLPAEVGDRLEYTITVTNNNDYAAASNIVICDTLNGSGDISFRETDNIKYEPGTYEGQAVDVFTIGTIPAGGSVDITYTYIVQAEDANQTLTNFAFYRDGDGGDSAYVEVDPQYKLTVEHYIDGELHDELTDVTTMNKGDAWRVEVGGTDNDNTYNAPESLYADGVRYTFDEIATTDVNENGVAEGTLTEDTTVKLYYSKDEIGTEDPDEPDDIPDKYQVTILYEADHGGKIKDGALTREVVNVYGKDRNFAEKGIITANGSEAVPNANYGFKVWTLEREKHAPFNTGIHTAAFSDYQMPPKGQEDNEAYYAIGGETYIFTATFVGAELELEKSAAIFGKTEHASAQAAIPVAEVGDLIEYEIHVHNVGTVHLTNVVISDATNAAGQIQYDQSINSNLVSYDGNGKFTVRDLQVGQVVTIVYYYEVTAKDAGKTILNIAVANFGGDEEPSDSAEVEVKTPAPQLSVEKTLIDPTKTSYAVGETIKWNITVTNSGNADGYVALPTDTMSITKNGTTQKVELTVTTTAVAETDGEYAGKYKIPADNGSVVFTASYTVEDDDLGAVINNTAKVGELEDTPDTPVEVKDAVLTVQKTADNYEVKAGQTVTWTITVTNSGNADGYTKLPVDLLTVGDATQPESLTVIPDDDLTAEPDGTFKVPAGGKITFTASYKAEQDGVTLKNKVTIAGGEDVDEDVTVLKNYTVTYKLQGDLPEGLRADYHGPTTYAEKDDVDVLKAPEYDPEAYGFSGWYSEHVDVESGSFTMPAQDVVIIGVFEAKNPDISVEKDTMLVNEEQYVKGTSVAKPGDWITWKITVENAGNAAGKYTLQDKLSGVTVYEGYNNGDVGSVTVSTTKEHTIGAGETQYFTAKYQVKDTDTGSIVNSVQLGTGKEDKTDDEKVPVANLSVTDKTVVKVGETEIAEGVTIPVAKAGETIIWQITVQNTGDAETTLNVAELGDTVQYLSGSTWVDFEGDLGKVTFNVPQVTVPAAAENSDPGEVTIQVSWVVPTAAYGKTVRNLVDADPDDGDDPDPEIPSEQIEIEDEPKAVLDVSKKLNGDKTLYAVGETITWTVTVTNSGNADGEVKQADILDTIKYKDGDSYTDFDPKQYGKLSDGQSWPVTVPAKGSVTFTVEWKVPAEAAGKVIKNFVQLGDGPEIPGGPDIETEKPDITAEKTVEKIDQKDNNTTVDPGDVITWKIVVTNNGKVAGKFQLIDQLRDKQGNSIATLVPTGEAVVDEQGYYTIGANNANNATVEFTATYTVTTDDQGKDLVNVAVVKPEGEEKKEYPSKPVESHYTVTYKYEGDVPADAPKLPETKSYDPETTEKVAEKPAMEDFNFIGWTTDDVIVNENDEFVINNHVTFVGSWEKKPTEYTIVKTVESVGGVKVTDQKKIPTAQVGDEIVWNIVLTWTKGPETTVTVKDILKIGNDLELPLEVTAEHKIGPKNKVHSFHATYKVTEEDRGKVLQNIVVVNKDPEVPAPDVKAEADLSVKKTVTSITTKGEEKPKPYEPGMFAKVGDTIEWTIVVTNEGDTDGETTLRDTMTGGRESKIEIKDEATGKKIANNSKITVPAGATKTYIVTYKVVEDDKNALLENGVKLDDGDKDPKDDPKEDSDPVSVEDPKLEVTKTADRTAAKVGETITYTIKVKNTGNVDLVNVMVKENFSGDLNNITVTQSPAGTQFSAADGTFTIPVLAEGDEVFIVFTYVPEATGKLTNAVVVTGKTEGDTDSDDDPTDKTDPTETEVTEQDKPGIEAEKAVNKTTVEVGDKVIYTIKVTNTGNVKLTNVVVDESNFSGDFSKIFDVKTEATDVTTDKGNDRFVIADMIPGEVVEITFSYKTTEEGTLKNSVTVTGKPENGTDPTDEDKAPDVKVEEEDDPITPVGPTPELDKGGDHLSYIIGYPDGTVQPMGTITRAEVATIFFRLLTDESRAYYWSQENNFSDVAVTDWFNNAVSTMAAAGIVNGYPDGTFRPQDPVSRAEFAAIATRFTEEGRDGVSQKYFKQYFKDVNKDDWFAAAVELAYELGWAQGYEGSYRPEDDMTRAEVMTMVNRIMEREVEADDMLDDMIFWPDNLPEAWYYEAVQEATNSHTYKRTNKKVPNLDFYYEEWKKLIENPDWAALERSWSDANSQN